MTESYDALIVGAGPAGLSAALILGRCRRRILLCDSGGHRNSASQAIHGLLGHEGRLPSELLAIGSRELKNYASVMHSRVRVHALRQGRRKGVCAQGAVGHGPD
jgi:thioredoxin reductase